MLKANDFNRYGCRTFIVHFPCRKMKTFLFARIISQNLAFSLLQIQHKPSFLLVLIPTQTIFSTCFNPKIGNLRYLCNLTSFSFYSSEYQFQVRDYQLLLFIYVIKIQLVVMTNNFLFVLYQSKNIFLLFSRYFSFRKSSYKQVIQKYLNSQPECLLFNIQEVQ